MVGEPGDAADGALAARIRERLDDLRREVERLRFAGGNPAIELRPDDPPVEVVAKTLAAERLRTQLRVEGELFNPQEDLAEDAFQRALMALRYGNFGGARALLDEAGALSADPVRLQRVALFKEIVRLVRAVVLTDLDAELRDDADRRVLDLLGTLDRLPVAEVEHYRGEVERLMETRRRAGEDLVLRTAWCLLRARIAAQAGDEALGLAWLYHAFRLNEAAAAPGPYLAELLAAARTRVLALVGERAPDEEGGAEEAPEVRSAELAAALTAHLERATGRDLRREAQRFGVETWRGE